LLNYFLDLGLSLVFAQQTHRMTVYPSHLTHTLLEIMISDS